MREINKFLEYSLDLYMLDNTIKLWILQNS